VLREADQTTAQPESSVEMDPSRQIPEPTVQRQVRGSRLDMGNEILEGPAPVVRPHDNHPLFEASDTYT